MCLTLILCLAFVPLSAARADCLSERMLRALEALDRRQPSATKAFYEVKHGDGYKPILLDQARTAWHEVEAATEKVDAASEALARIRKAKGSPEEIDAAREQLDALRKVKRKKRALYDARATELTRKALDATGLQLAKDTDSVIIVEGEGLLGARRVAGGEARAKPITEKAKTFNQNGPLKGLLVVPRGTDPMSLTTPVTRRILNGKIAVWTTDGRYQMLDVEVFRRNPAKYEPVYIKAEDTKPISRDIDGRAIWQKPDRAGEKVEQDPELGWVTPTSRSVVEGWNREFESRARIRQDEEPLRVMTHGFEQNAPFKVLGKRSNRVFRVYEPDGKTIRVIKGEEAYAAFEEELRARGLVPNGTH